MHPHFPFLLLEQLAALWVAFHARETRRGGEGCGGWRLSVVELVDLLCDRACELPQLLSDGKEGNPS